MADQLLIVPGSSGGGGGSPGGTNGQVQYNNAGTFGGFTVGGDGTLNTGTGALTVTKTNGVAFAASATTDTTNAANISSGILPDARLSNVIAAGGPTGSTTVAPIITYDAHGRLTAVTSATIAPAAGSITGGAALTKTDDTNVTLTLGGTPASALLAATSLTLGWTGTLAAARGGTANGFFAVAGPATTTKTFTFPNASANVLTDNAAVTVAQGGTGLATLTAHAVILGEGTGNVAFATIGTGGRVLIDQGAAADPAFTAVSGDGTLAAGGALTVTKTNGTVFGALATLGVGTGLSSSGGNLNISGTITAGGPTGSATVAPIITYNAQGQLTAVSSATITPAAGSITGGAALTAGNDTNVTLTLGGAPTTALLSAASVTAGWTGILASARGGTANGFFTVAGPATSAKTYTFPNASANVLTDNAAVTVAQGGTGLGTLTAHAVLLGEGTGNVAFATIGTSGRVLVDQGSGADPSFNAVSGDATLTNTGSLAVVRRAGGMINKFRNGTMDVWQRGTSAITVTTSGAYTADGWIVVPTGASCTVQQAAGRLLTSFSAQLVGATSVTDILIKQRIEGSIAAPLTSQNVTVQAQITNNTGGSVTPTLTVKHANAVDNWGATTTDVSAVSLQACGNGSTTQVAYTFAASASSANGLEITFDFGNNFSATGKSVSITEVDIRATPGVATGLNSNPPVPELRPIATELAFCQRYYEKSYLQSVVAGTATQAGAPATFLIGLPIASYNTGATATFQTQKRVAPSIVLYSPSTGASGQLHDYVSGVDVAGSAGNIGTVNFVWSGANTLSAGYNFQVQWTASAEL